MTRSPILTPGGVSRGMACAIGGRVALVCALGAVAAASAHGHGETPPTRAGLAQPAAEGMVRTLPADPPQSWPHLSAEQRRALAPLANTWSGMTAAQRSKWLVLSQHFAQRTTAEQALLHSRMAEWAALSPQERRHARIQFSSAQFVPADQRLAQWQAYQALPEDERRGLASAAPPVLRGAAVLQKTPASRFTRVAAHGTTEGVRRPARIPTDGQYVDRATLLPLAGPSAG